MSNAARPLLCIGIDPGMTGAVAWLYPDGDAAGIVLNTADGFDMTSHLRPEANHTHYNVQVALEKVGSMPGNSASSMFKFGTSFGVAKGVVQALGLPLTLITPQRWNAVAFRGRKKPKEKPARKRAVLEIARERWPMADLKLVRDGAIAEALFMALTLQQELGSSEEWVK